MSFQATFFRFCPTPLSVTHSTGLQWLLPLGRDAEVNRIILQAGALNVLLAVILAPHFAHIGMAGAVVCAEMFVSFSMVRAVLRSQSELHEPVPPEAFRRAGTAGQANL